MSENFALGSQHHTHHPPRPQPCEACGSRNVVAYRRGDKLIITCKDCDHVAQQSIPTWPPHEEEA